MLGVFALIARPTRQGASTLLLPAIAYACVTALLAIVLGGAQTFWGYDDELAGTYWMFTGLALVLLVLPLVSLGAAAAKLSTRRRDDRLAALRLLGATGRTTAAIALLEAVLVAAVGAVAGIAVAYASAPLIGLIRFRGEALGASGVALPPWASALLLLAVVAIAAVSAVASLRRVIISPLGVALRQSAPKLPWKQGLFALAAILVSVVVLNSLGAVAAGIAVVVATLLACFAVALLAIDLIGPWVLGLLGRRRARRAQDPAGLLSARMILESPRAAWRQVSGVVMTRFTAVFAGAGLAMLDVGGDAAFSGPEQYLPGDIRTGVLITVVGAFVMVACSVGVGQAAQILDRRSITRSLEMIGSPFAVQEAARRASTLLPLLLASAGSAIIAAILLFPLLGIAILVRPITVAVVLASIAAGFGLVVLALLATRPLLRGVAAGR